ncbi:MAG: hypothetical protein ACPG47_00155 [Leucothrix sp.]
MATNILVDVATYQKADLALLQNSFCFINKANKKFKNFEKFIGNRGATVTFDLPPRFASGNGTLVANFQDSEQRVQSLVVDQAENIAMEYTAQEEIFNVADYLDVFGRSAVAELGTVIESNVAENAVTKPYRFYGDGINPVNSYGELAKALSFFRNYGAPLRDTRAIIPDIEVPDVVNTGLNQFALNRNNEDAMSWELGKFSNCDWYQSNLLPLHTAGTVGQAATTLTVVSINAAGDQITLSGAAVSDPDAIKENDLLEFQDAVVGQPNMRYLTFIGHKPSANPVQVRATADAASDGAGQVVVSIFPALVDTALDRNQNINNPVAAGMEIKALPNTRRGVIYAGDALYLALPRLPSQEPFPTANEADKDSGASMRMYYGTKFGLNQKGFVHDAIWGSTLVPEYSMAIVYPE